MSTLSRRMVLAGLSLPFLKSDVHASVKEKLLSQLPFATCEQRKAIEGSVERLKKVAPPTQGRVITIDIPSGHLVAYEQSRIVLESRAVVGNPDWKTPALNTKTTFVRFNPTWTVPKTIIHEKRWREKLKNDPGYFDRLGFKIQVGNRLLSPFEAVYTGNDSLSFIQSPGPSNAMGAVKIGLLRSQSIYLHGTPDKDSFDSDNRYLSHGCIRVENIVKLASWLLQMNEENAYDLIRKGDQQDRTPPSVRVVTSYFTAWPDQNGHIQYYNDIYGVDERCS